MVRPRFAVLAFGLLLLGASTGLPGTPFAARMASAVTCPSGQRQAFVSFHATFAEYAWTEGYDGGGQPHRLGFITVVPAGTNSGTVTYTFCDGQVSGVWAVRSNATGVESGLNNLTKDSAGKLYTSGTGYMLEDRKLGSNSAVVAAIECSKNGLPSFLKAVAGVPLIGVSTAVQIGVWIAATLLPEGGVDCGSASGDVTANLRFSSTGDASAVFAANGSSTYTDTHTKYSYVTSGPCVTSGYQNCEHWDEWQWTYTAN
jgi:hypothetical protein